MSLYDYDYLKNTVFECSPPEPLCQNMQIPKSITPPPCPKKLQNPNPTPDINAFFAF